MNFLVQLLALPLGIMAWAWGLSVAWSWFAPVISQSIQLLSFAQCVALRAVLNFLKSCGPYVPTSEDEESKRKRTYHMVACAIFVPFGLLLIAWIIHLFVHV